MSYKKKNGVGIIEAGSLVRGNFIEVIEGRPQLRYYWREIVKVEQSKEHSNRVKITFSGGRVTIYPKNQSIRYKKGE